MTGDRFETVLRSMPGVGSRRRAIASIAALATYAAIGVSTGGDAAAAPRQRKKRNGNPCRHKPDGATCDNKGQCLSGKCKRAPTCDSAGAVCGEGQLDCCSGRCVIALGESTGSCLPGDADAKCRVDGDCTSGQCIGFRCRG